MFMTSGELLGRERHPIGTRSKKNALVRESLEPEQSVSVVARRNDTNANQLFLECKLYQDGSLSASVSGGAGFRAVRCAQIRELQRMLGKKTKTKTIKRDYVAHIVTLFREKHITPLRHTN